MPCDNYNYDYEPSGAFIDINQECYTFDEPVDVDIKLKETVTFISQTYYRTNFVTPNRCCCGGGGCKPEPGPCPPEPGPCPPGPGPCPPDPDCFDGVYCNDVLYPTIESALADNPCAESLFVGCGVYELPTTLSGHMCIIGRGSDVTMLCTEPGQKIVDDDLSIMDLSFVPRGSERSSEPGLSIEASNFFIKNVDFKYEEKRQIDLYFTGQLTKASVINCNFSESGNYGIMCSNFSGVLSITSCEFNNPTTISILSSPDCELRAVTSKFVGQVSYDCSSAEFNGCEFLIGAWKKINILPKCNTEFVSCVFDDQRKSGWVDASRSMRPIIGMRIGCRETGITYKINGCSLTSGKNAEKQVVFLSEGKDKEPGYIFLNGIEQEIDNSNWGRF